MPDVADRGGADQVIVLVVHLFEVVEVHHEEREGTGVPPEDHEVILQELVHVTHVAQARQVVGERHLFELAVRCGEAGIEGS